MSQTQTGVGTKITGNTYTAAEFNSVNGAVNANATDALSKGETTDQALASNLALAEDKNIKLEASGSGATSLALLSNSVGLIAFDQTRNSDIVKKLGQAAGNLYFEKSDGTVLLRLKSSGSAMQIPTFGAGTMQTDASGNVSVSSDSRLKNPTRAFQYGVTEVCQLADMMGFFNWKEISGMETQGEYASFYADQVYTVMPEAAPKNVIYKRESTVIGKDKDGKDILEWNDTDEIESDYHTLSDRPIIMALTRACRDQSETIKALTARLDAAGI